MNIEFVVLFVALLGVIGFLGARLKKLKSVQCELSNQNDDLTAENKDLLVRYSDIIDVDAAVSKQQQKLSELKDEVSTRRSKWESEIVETVKDIDDLKVLLDTTRSEVDSQSFGLYEPHFDFDTPEKYKEAILRNRSQQKDAVKNEEAAKCDAQWEVGGSAAKGRQMTKRNLKLMLRAFNGESDAAVAKVKYNNVSTLENRIEKAWVALNKLGKSNQTYITENYLALKIEELRLQHEYKEAKHEALEEQRQLRAKIREEERALKEIEKAKALAEKEEKRSAEALEKAREELRAAGEEVNDKLQAKIAGLEAKLAEAQTNKERALSRAQMTKSGHVYVISNEGSFGEGVYKIGMTRRLEPMDRVKELGDASVPFSFDVHAMIYADDAPGLEADLHRSFDSRRVNLVNRRKEFFRVDLQDVAELVNAKDFDIEFTMLGEAEEFRKTQAILLAQDENSTSEGGSKAVDAVELVAFDRLEKLKRLNAEESA